MTDKELIAILRQMNPRQGENGAWKALQEARKGNYTRLIDRYNLSRTELDNKPFEQVIAEAWNNG